MRTHILFIIIAICSLSLTTSCTSREQKVVKRLEKLSKKLERQGNDYSITQWQRAAKEFKQIDERLPKITKTSPQNNSTKSDVSRAFA